MIAKASRNPTRARGIRLPSRARTPRAKAISVAIGMPQPADGILTVIDRDIDQGRQEHTAHRRGCRQDRLPEIGEMAHQHLPFDLKTDKEEKEGHETIVYPMMQTQTSTAMEPGPRVNSAWSTDSYTRGERAVGDDKGQDRGDHQQDAGRSLIMDEFVKRGPGLAEIIQPGGIIRVGAGLW